MSLAPAPLAPRALAMFFVGALSSCSLVAIKRAPARKPASAAAAAELSCSDGLTFPLVDMAGTVLAGALSVSLIASDNKDDLKTASYSSAGLGIVLAASAIYGMFQVQRCRAAKGSQGGLRPDLDAPAEDREPPGTHGGACKADGSCDDDLFCDEPMQVCVPLNPEGASP